MNKGIMLLICICTLGGCELLLQLFNINPSWDVKSIFSPKKNPDSTLQINYPDTLNNGHLIDLWKCKDIAKDTVSSAELKSLGIPVVKVYNESPLMSYPGDINYINCFL